MRMKWLLVILSMVLPSTVAGAADRDDERDDERAGGQGPTFAGGMMLMGGGVDLQDTFAGMKGVTFGVGGRLVFMVGYGFRVGVLGGTGKMSYGKHDSHFQYNHSALSAEWGTTFSRLTMTAGVSGGWARYYLLDKQDVSPDGLITAREYQQDVPSFSPFVSLEYPLTGRLRATLFIDYPWMSVEGHRHGGLRVGAGILFVR